MNLQRIKQVVLCAAIVALVVAGAELFSTQPVAGQETKSGALHGAAALDRLKQDGQYESLQAAMREARFGVSRAEQTPLGRAAWHAPNPEAGYDAYVTESGVSIVVNDNTYVSLSLQSLGYGGAMQPVGPGEVNGDKQTISLMRSGGVREWYVNGPGGLEQGFTLAKPPSSAGERDEPLRLALQVSEGWRAAASDDGKAVTLRGADGHSVEYGKLVVRDSLGRVIPARLTVIEEQVVIEAEDSKAEYPLTIDPIFSLQPKPRAVEAAPVSLMNEAQYVEQQRLTANDGAEKDHFGEAIALDGDTLVVGAYADDIGATSNQGSVYVFTRSGATWTFQQKITANDGAAYDYFGESVAVYGNFLAVGSHVSSNVAVGAVYVFTRSGATWTQQQKITANDGVVGDDFGHSVSMSDWTLVVGAPGDNINGNNLQGSAYVYTRIGAVWTLQKKLFAADGSAQDTFGVVVSLNGDTVAVGAYFDNIGANEGQGSVYIYKRYGTIWLPEPKLIAFDGANGDLFGIAVALGSDTLVVGAKSDDIGANSAQGSAYVYVNSGGGWTLQQKLTASDGAEDESFGAAVALSGDTLAVSAYLTDNGTFGDLGSVYVFKRSGAVWTEIKKITGGDSADWDVFGKPIAMNGDTVMVAASWDDIDTTEDQGSVYVFVNPPCPVLTFAPASLPGGPSGAFYYQQITVSGGVGPYQFELAGGALPSGVILKTNGSLEGFLPAPGTSDFTISVTDSSSGCSGARAYSITVGQPCPSITINPPVLPNSAVGAVYQQQLTASGSAGPYKFDSSGTLPPGLTLTINGLLSGMPTTPGSYLFKIRATDVNTQCYVIVKYTVTIAASCRSITIDPPALPTGATGMPYSETLTGIGGVEPYKFYVKGKLPPGLSLNTNGVLSGTPTQPGYFPFILGVSDARGCTGSRGDSITIKKVDIEIGVTPRLRQ